MQKWEYYYFWADDIYGITKFSNSEVQTDEYIRELGEKGWELVSVTRNLTDHRFAKFNKNFVFFFKRPIEE